jgi:hypothetical protein
MPSPDEQYYRDDHLYVDLRQQLVMLDGEPANSIEGGLACLNRGTNFDWCHACPTHLPRTPKGCRPIMWLPVTAFLPSLNRPDADVENRQELMKRV